MALFRMDRAYAWTPEMMLIDGSVTIPTGLTLTTVNLQINPALLNTVSGTGLPNPGTSNLLSNETIAPLGSRGRVYLNPNGSAVGAASNQNPLPLGLAAGATGTLGSELVLDLSGFDADIVAASASMYSQSNRGVAQARQCYVSAVDNINKLVYVQIVTSNSNTFVSIAAGDVVNFDIALKDTFSV